jgi:hypothetical protein
MSADQMGLLLLVDIEEKGLFCTLLHHRTAYHFTALAV